MKTFKLVLILVLVNSLRVVAQLATTANATENWVQYKMDKNQFHISFPESWAVGSEEKKILTNWMSILAAKTTTFPKAAISVVANPVIANYNSNKKFWNKSHEQTAKKEKDKFYQVFDEGDFEKDNGAKYYYKKYQFTMTFDDGVQEERVRLFYMYMPPNKKMNKLFIICQFDASLDDMDKLENTYKEIFNSLNFESI
ncbi:hypothetical protein [Flexithrix dorotheae]|uniref:hypothetical protein n=1 Tax=Flexithrix dorotheae TaxID=70993 RepID=UPI00036A955C|nr:hypothetical protein [Flexithrix dorotheae]